MRIDRNRKERKKHKRIRRKTHVGHERRLPHARLDPLPVEALEEPVELDLLGPVPAALAAQPALGALLQQLLAQALGLLCELVRVLLLVLLDPAVDLVPLDLLLARPEGRLALDHLVQETAEAEPVGRERVLLVVDDLGRHVAHGADPAAHHVALGYLDGQPEVGDAHVAVVVEEDVLGLAVAVDDALEVQVLEATDHLGCVEPVWVEERVVGLCAYRALEMGLRRLLCMGFISAAAWKN